MANDGSIDLGEVSGGVPPLRRALAARLGMQLTPEVAAAIEMAVLGLREPIDVSQMEPLECGEYAISATRLRPVLEELHELHRQHWQETERHRHGLPLRPNYHYMLQRDLEGTLLQFVVRKDGQIVGHLRMYVGMSLHSGTKFAEEDTLFVAPEHRTAMLGLKLLRYAEKCLLSIGVREIRADSKLINKADVLMRRLGYTPVATKFVKIFPEGQAMNETAEVSDVL